jgi:hypothetical protein
MINNIIQINVYTVNLKIDNKLKNMGKITEVRCRINFPLYKKILQHKKWMWRNKKNPHQNKTNGKKIFRKMT